MQKWLGQWGAFNLLSHSRSLPASNNLVSPNTFCRSLCPTWRGESPSKLLKASAECLVWILCRLQCRKRISCKLYLRPMSAFLFFPQASSFFTVHICIQFLFPLFQLLHIMVANKHCSFFRVTHCIRFQYWKKRKSALMKFRPAFLMVPNVQTVSPCRPAPKHQRLAYFHEIAGGGC